MAHSILTGRDRCYGDELLNPTGSPSREQFPEEDGLFQYSQVLRGPPEAQGRVGEVSEEVMTVALSQMREELHPGGVQRKRDVLRSFVDRIEAERERARLWYTFPLLQQRVFYSMPPAEFESALPP